MQLLLDIYAPKFIKNIAFKKTIFDTINLNVKTFFVT